MKSKLLTVITALITTALLCVAAQWASPTFGAETKQAEGSEAPGFDSKAVAPEVEQVFHFQNRAADRKAQRQPGTASRSKNTVVRRPVTTPQSEKLTSEILESAITAIPSLPLGGF